jgi:hypothetical protein
MEKLATSNDSKRFFRSVLGFVDPTDYSKRLADATTSSQLKSAVDSLPQHEKYYTERIRDLLLAKKNLIVDAETVDSVVKFLFSFSGEYSLLPLLQTKGVHDLVINTIAPLVTAIHEFGRLIDSIEVEKSAALFFNVEFFTAILKCFHRSKTSNDARWIASSINKILKYNPSSNKLFNSLPVVEAFSFIIPLANDEDAGRWILYSLQNIIKDNEDAKNKFAAPEFLEMLKGMEKHLTEDESTTELQTVLELLMKK